jgi:hypothetical protein
MLHFTDHTIVTYLCITIFLSRQINDDILPIFFTTPSVRKDYSGFHLEFDDFAILKQQTHFKNVILTKFSYFPVIPSKAE